MDNPANSNESNASIKINTCNATSGLDISILDTTNMSTNIVVFFIPFKGKTSSISKAENGFYKINFTLTK